MVGSESVINLRPEQPSLAREDSSSTPQASKEVDKGSRLEHLAFTKKDSRPTPQASKKGRRVPKWRRAPGAGVEDFVPWVAPISSRPPASEEEEERNEMADLVHNFGGRKRKQGAIFKRATNATSEVVGEADQHPTGGGSEELAIVVMDSPKTGFQGQSALETAPSADLGEVPPTHEEVREGIPSEQTTSRPAKATSSRSGRSRSLLPDRLLLYSYIHPQGLAPPMEEVSALRLEGAQEIINRWKPFNQGESMASHLEQLYPTMLRIPIDVRAEGKGEKYVVSIPTYACKEDLKQVVEDGRLIRNRNFVQSTELVHS